MDRPGGDSLPKKHTDPSKSADQLHSLHSAPNSHNTRNTVWIDCPKSPTDDRPQDDRQDNGKSHAFVRQGGLNIRRTLCGIVSQPPPPPHLPIKSQPQRNPQMPPGLSSEGHCVRCCDCDQEAHTGGSLIIFRPKVSDCWRIDFDENRKIANNRPIVELYPVDQ